MLQSKFTSGFEDSHWRAKKQRTRGQKLKIEIRLAETLVLYCGSRTGKEKEIRSGSSSLVEVLVLFLEQIGSLKEGEFVKEVSVTLCWVITHLLSHHVDRVLNAAVRDDGNNGGIDDSKVLHAVYPQLWVDHALLNVLR